MKTYYRFSKTRAKVVGEKRIEGDKYVGYYSTKLQALFSAESELLIEISDLQVLLRDKKALLSEIGKRIENQK